MYLIHSMAGETALATLEDSEINTTILVTKKDIFYADGDYHLTIEATQRLLDREKERLHISDYSTW